MSFVLVAVTGLDGITTKPRTSRKNTRKVGFMYSTSLLSVEVLYKGKYLLERERLVKDNAWTLDA
jgi:hypothetical protein